MTLCSKKHWLTTTAVIGGLIGVAADGAAFAQDQPQGAGQAASHTAAKPQSTPKTDPAAKPSDAPTEVVVTGTRKEVDDRIDRRVYDIKNDPESQTGMATDVLAKLPSVQVSPTGHVSLRGDPNVSVMIDGKFPAGKDVAVQTMAASDIDRVEVMTNPSAQYAPDGASGIINIITKRRHPTGISGNINNRLSTQGQEVFGASAVITKGPWSIDSRFGYIHSPSESASSFEQPLPYAASGRSRTRNTYDNFNLPISVAYKLSDIDTITLQTQDYMRRNKNHITQGYHSIPLSYESVQQNSAVSRTNAIDLLYDRNDPKTGVHLTLDAGHADSAYTYGADILETFGNGTSSIYGDRTRRRSPNDEIKGDFERRFDSGRLVTAGFDWSRSGAHADEGHYDHGAVAGPVADGYHHLLDGEETIAGVYVTFQTPLGGWTILPGLRVEDEQHEVRAGGLEAGDGNTKLYPSLHLSHPLGKQGKLKLSYSRRVARPGIDEYDPGVTYTSRISIGIGNPNLKPTDTDSYEAEYDYTKGPTSYTTTVYYRLNTNIQSFRSTVRSDNIIVDQPVNAGQSHAGGAEFTLRAQLSKRWKYSVDVNVYDQETPLFSGGSRDDFSYNTNGQIEYDAPAANGKGLDQFQTVFTLRSRRYSPQGYSDGTGSLGLIWQHPLTAKVSLVVTASNLLQTKTSTFVTNGPGLQARTIGVQDNQALLVALAYKFGGKK